jgi:sialidase-1
MKHRILITVAILIALVTTLAHAQDASTAGVTKTKEVVIYRDDTFYSAFPSIIRRPDGELMVAFRRAPNPRNFGSRGYTHTDPCSQLVLVRSRDNGATWSEPRLIFAHPRGGLQDPCLLQLDDGSILCSSYGWALIPSAVGQNLKNPSRLGDFVFMGGLLLRSDDNGEHWSEIPLPAIEGQSILDPFNQPIPVYNRGAMCQGSDGRVYWAIASRGAGGNTETHLMISEDRGLTWNYSCPIAADDKVVFNETSLYQTPKGDLVAFMRTANFNDHTTMARSTDGGRSFEPWIDTGFKGHPHHAIRLPDDRVLLVYGYRHAPHGIRARVLDAECTNFATAPEIVLREDGGNGNLGYPWATMISDTEALVVYYFNQKDGTRHIAGTVLRID